MALTQVAGGMLAGSITSSQISSVAASTLTGSQSIPKSTLPTGSVLQVVQGTYSTQVTNATQTNADSGLTATITPSSATSKILCIVNMAGLYNGGTTGGIQLQLIRGSTNIIQFARYTSYVSSGAGLITNAGTNYLDSPSTTSATTYTVQFCKSDGAAGAVGVQQNGDTSAITLQEISA